MKNIKSSVIICDIDGNILLQKRDEEPERDKWVLFGGSVEPRETEDEAVKREIYEELKYKIKRLSFFKRYNYGDVEQPIYIAEEPVSLNDLTLCEGIDMKFFKPEEINFLDIGFNYKKIILEYLSSKRKSYLTNSNA